jgi:hypothetical protein
MSLLSGHWLMCSFYANAQALEGKSKSPRSDVRTTICEVVSDPASFDGKIIEVRAAVLAGIETNLLYDKKSLQGKLPARILFISEEQTFERTGEYRRFWNLVHAYRKTKGGRRSITPDKYTVTATFRGLFSIVGSTGQLVTSQGMLKVKSVRDVEARSFDDFLSATNLNSSAKTDNALPQKTKPE